MSEDPSISDPRNYISVDSSVLCLPSAAAHCADTASPEKHSPRANHSMGAGDMNCTKPSGASLPFSTDLCATDHSNGRGNLPAIDRQSYDTKENIETNVVHDLHDEKTDGELLSSLPLSDPIMFTNPVDISVAATNTTSAATCVSGESSVEVEDLLVGSSSATSPVPSSLSGTLELFTSTSATLNSVLTDSSTDTINSAALPLPSGSLSASASGPSSNSESSSVFTLPPTSLSSEFPSGQSSNSDSSPGFTPPSTPLSSILPGPSSDSTPVPDLTSFSNRDPNIDDSTRPYTCTSVVAASGSSDCSEGTSSRDESVDVDADVDVDRVRRSQPDLTAVPVRSSLKRRRVEPDGDECMSAAKRARGRNIQFDNVTVIYFPRAQGFTCVPSQGGSTLGMAKQHSHSERFSLAEYALLKREAQRCLLTKLRTRQKRSVQVVSTSSEDSDVTSELSDMSDSELDVDSCFFLRPMLTRQRRLMLRSSGVRKIEPAEREECRVIRSSREFCGCVCRVVCLPETCLCASSNIKCQVDRQNFPCGCTREGCQNPNGRIEFNPVRVRKHYVETILREQQFGHWSDPPTMVANGGSEWQSGSLFPYPLPQDDLSSSCSENSDDTGSCDSGETSAQVQNSSSSLMTPTHPQSLSASQPHQQHSHYSQFSFDGGLQTFQSELSASTSWSSQLTGFSSCHYGPRVYESSYANGYQQAYAHQYDTPQLPTPHYSSASVSQTLQASKAVSSEDSGVDVDMVASCRNVPAACGEVADVEDVNNTDGNHHGKQDDTPSPSTDESIGELIKKSMVESVSA